MLKRKRGDPFVSYHICFLLQSILWPSVNGSGLLLRIWITAWATQELNSLLYSQNCVPAMKTASLTASRRQNVAIPIIWVWAETPGWFKGIWEYLQRAADTLWKRQRILPFPETQMRVVATVSQSQMKMLKTLRSSRGMTCKSVTYTYSTCPLSLTWASLPLPTRSVLSACLRQLLYLPWNYPGTWQNTSVRFCSPPRPPFLLECTPTNPNSVKGYWWSGCLSENDGPGGKQKSCIVSNQEMSADLRETLQTHQGTQTNIKTNGVFAKRCVFAQEREVGNEARSQAGLDVLLVADSTIGEEHSAQAASLKKRLESKLRIQ